MLFIIFFPVPSTCSAHGRHTMNFCGLELFKVEFEVKRPGTILVSPFTGCVLGVLLDSTPTALECGAIGV